MMKIKVTSGYSIKLARLDSTQLLLRQTPGGDGLWDGIQFLVNQDVAECDAWFIFDSLPAPETTRVPEGNTIFITAEPPAYKKYSPKWLRQFGHLITSHRGLDHPSVKLSQCGLPWFVDKTYTDLAGLDLPTKNKALSVICSSRTLTAGHRRRLKFVKALAKRLPTMDVFGRGHREIADKWDALAPYRYSIAIENCVQPDYWTEKIGDCYLAGTIPIYHGCPNIADYFPANSFEPIDPENVDAAAARITTLMERQINMEQQSAIQQSRHRVLHDYNLFNLMATFARTLPPSSSRSPTTLLPEPEPSSLARRLTRLRHTLGVGPHY